MGNNACLHLNLPPDRNGLIDRKDVARLKEYGRLIAESFSSPVDYTVLSTDESCEIQPEFLLKVSKPIKDIRFVVLQEDLTQGQRIASFLICTKNNHHQFPLYQGYCVGHKKICCLCDPFAAQNPLLAQEDGENELIIKIPSSRGKVHLKNIALY